MANIIRIGGGSGSTPILITKSITQNGTYRASDDNADGYSEVTVNVSGGSPQTQFRYLKWHITDNGVNNNVLQIAEVEFRNENDVAFTMPTGFTATSSMPPFVPEDDVYVLFDGTDRKLVILPWVSGTSVEDITIDLGAGNYLDISEYPYFCWKAGNDDNQYVGRAPRVWQLYGANQSDFSDAVVLDNTTVPVNTQNAIWAYKSRMILNVIDSGGGELHLLYSLDQSQGGQWLNTNIDTTQYDKLLFINSVNGDDGYMREIAISDIIVVNSGTANDYTEVFSAGAIGKMFICHIYNNELWVGYNASGSSGNVVSIYNGIVLPTTI